MKKNYFKTLGLLCLGMFAFELNAQTTYYVKTDGTGGANTATTWGTASKDLQDVINTAQAGDKIFVAAGTYLPNRPANNLTTIDAANRDNAFVLKNGVNIYGGFVGSEANETQRVAGNTSILSGDLGGNDVEETGANTTTYMTLNKTDNAYHVVLAIAITDNTIFDGFTVTKGDASATALSTLTVGTKVIDRRVGGGIYILESSANFQIFSVTATINRANGDGDATGGGGGGFYINNSSPTIANCTITKCFSMHATPKSNGSNYGSGMSMVVASSPNITNTIFSDNFSGSGGAVAINGGSPLFTNCTFKLNRGNVRGGAIDVRASTPKFTACLISENTATGSGGGGVFNYSGRATFLNCIFQKNTASTANGGAYGSQNGNYGAIFINNTFYDNRNNYGNATTGYSAGVYVNAVGTSTDYTDKKTYLYSNLFYGSTAQYNTNKNTIDLFVIDPTLIGAINYNIIQQTAYTENGTNNKINVNPAFISTTFGHIGFLAPGSASPAKDAGNDSDNTALLDFNGRARKNGTIDIGAVEFHTVLPVSFISFAAKATNGGAQLNWKVGSETNNKQYILSRSSDGKNYSLVTKIAGAGTSAKSLNYNFTDKDVAGGTFYYKLEQEDLDGEINYLATQVIKIGLAATGVSVYPNPTKGNATVAVSAGNYNKYSVIGLQGNIVLNGNIGSTDTLINLNLSGLATGTYIIKLLGSTGSEYSRVVKL